MIIHPPVAAIGNKERERWMETEEGDGGRGEEGEGERGREGVRKGKGEFFV